MTPPLNDPEAVARAVSEAVASVQGHDATSVDAASILDRVQPLDWEEFWATDHGDVDWIAEPFIAAGRATALFSEAKAGKSLFALEMVAAIATGGTFLGRNLEPRTVCYFDYENHLGDIQQRLRDMGYEGQVFDRLHYFPLPALPPLDTSEGGAALRAIIEHYMPDVVVLDTLSRTTEGGENDSDTYRRFYEHTGVMLKRAGIAYQRLDHEGKDSTKGARGSSAKRDDVDFVWQMRKSSETRLTLKRTHSRAPWSDDLVTVERVSEPHLTHRPSTRKAADVEVWQPTEAMSKVSRIIEDADPDGLSKSTVEELAGFKAATTRQAVAHLEAGGYVRVDTGGRAHLVRHVKPYRAPEAEDATSHSQKEPT